MKVFLTILAIAILGVVVLLDQVACVKNIALAMGCEESLKNAYQQLYEFGDSNDHFPKTNTGNVDLAAVLESLDVADFESCLCTSNTEFDCYQFRGGLVPGELLPNDFDSDNANSIIAIEGTLNHAEMNGNFRTTGRFHVVVLSANSQTRRIDLLPNEHQSLLNRLRDGDMININTSFVQ